MLNEAAILSESQPLCDVSDSACFASYLASFVQMTRTYSPEAATLLEFAINQIAPETPALGPYANYSLIELTEALALAKSELQAGSGPYVCLAAVLDILHGRQCVPGTA